MSRRTDSPRSRSSASLPRARVAVLALIAGLCAAPAALAHPPYAGRTLDDALHELAAAGGLQLVYTAELVPPGATVAREPSAGPPLEAIAQVLAPAGLALERINDRTFAIVRVSRAPAAHAPAAAAGEQAARTLDEVVVTSSRYALASDVPDIHTFLTQDDLDALPRFAEDALKAVHRLPGAASNGLAGLAHIRGGEAAETLVQLDGLPLYEPFHLRLLQSPASVLDERIIAGLEAYAGGYTAEYGDRMSGIIDARSLRPEADAHYELGLSLMHANALASHRFASGRGQWLASFRRSNLDEIADAMHSDLGEPTYVDAFARVDYAWSPTTRGSLHLLVARDSAEVNNSAATEYSDAEYSNSYAWATLEHDWSPRLTTSGLVSYTDVAAERVATVDEPGARGIADDERDYDVIGLRLDARYTAERWMHRAGLDVRTLSANYDYTSAVTYAPGYPFPGATSVSRALAPSPSGAHVALYYTLRTQFTSSLTGEFGLRWDEQTYGVDADDQLGPRVNLAWRLDDRTRLLASWGRYQQFQGIEELQVEDGVDEFQRSQYADHTIVGLERDLGNAVVLRVEAYRKAYGRPRTRYENLYDPLSLAPELRWDRVAISPDSARAEGLELLLTHRQAGPWNGWLSYAWSRAADRLDGDAVRRSWDQTHTVNAGVGWAQGPWRASLVAQYHTGWPVTPVRVDGAGDIVVGRRNDGRYADFGSLDARVSREWSLPRGTLGAHLEITNALDRRNPCCTDFEAGVDENGAVTLRRDLRHWLPLVPSVGVLWKF